MKITSKYSIFCRAAELKSFTGAARELGYSQSAVSQIIKGLEEELGTRLITRSRGTFELTADGREYYPYFEAISKAEEALARRQREISGMENATIRVASFTSVSRELLPELMKGFKESHPGVDFVYPMHLNPNVRRPIHQVFGDDLTAYPNFFFIEPLQYLEFVFLMEKSTLVLTDSGGIQEEAPGLGKPVLVMRNTTERPEALDAGTVKLVGTDHDLIVAEVSRLLDDPAYYDKMSHAVNPYGDGLACSRIVNALR